VKVYLINLTEAGLTKYCLDSIVFGPQILTLNM